VALFSNKLPTNAAVRAVLQGGVRVVFGGFAVVGPAALIVLRSTTTQGRGGKVALPIRWGLSRGVYVVPNG